MSKKSKKRIANRNYQTQNQRGSSNPANLEHQEKELKEKLIYDRVEKGGKNNVIWAKNPPKTEGGWCEPWSDEDFSDDDLPGQTCKSTEQIHLEN